ncbi:MAG: 1,6-anhydro-N-acetylmuramyl-L-alanine amidase AmpD [Pseudohongiellaceae bacterium]|nr:1,6-anhydro-N-acetylmuramyl-L-alanine amidase AmpD [Pseudohongiellaceae bacterium]
MIKDHWLTSARRVESPNYNDRPAGQQVELLVIHNISLPPGQYGTGCVEQFFCNRLDRDAHDYFKEIADLQVSAHVLIERSGALIQFVPFDKRAWHAGKSSYRGRDNCNDFSIGIELEGCDDEPYSDVQYDTLAKLTQIIQEHYPEISPASIVGHCDIAPGRKTDPGECFDWDRYRRLCGQ